MTNPALRRRSLSTVRSAILWLSVLALAFIGLAGAAEPGEAPFSAGPPVVEVEGGKVRGVATNGLFVFKAIPFAQPAVGALRWRSPQPVKPWPGIRDALAFSADPVQVASPMLPPSAKTSEDCLYLNVWRPAAAGSEALPVMVWIYGGGLVRGGASLYPGEFLARQGIMVVSFNYRLGRLGFFAHPALAREAPDQPRGNYGYLDQMAALRWVQKNIRAFGGDPQNVTVAGESAGGGSVLVLLTSPLAHGLFQRAILESPGIPTPRAGAAPMRSLASAESVAVQYARTMGIEGDGAEALARLRDISAGTLAKGTEAYALAIFGGPEVPGLSHSIIDGQVVVEAPEAVLRAGRQAMVPVLVGANDYDLAVSPAQTKAALFAGFGSLAGEARRLYDPARDAPFKAVLQAVSADYGMIEPSRNLAELTAKAGLTAYFYRFAYVAEAQRQSVPGATHGSEIPFAFDVVAMLLKDRATKSDVEMGHTISGYWTSFVKTGDPNGGGRPAWPRYDPNSREVLSFTTNGVASGLDPLKERLDLWRAVWERAQ